MNIFVTGGSGLLIGSICAQLLEAGYAVTVYDDLSEGHRSAVDPAGAVRAGAPGRSRAHF